MWLAHDIMWMFMKRWVRKVDRNVKNNLLKLEAAIVSSAGETASLGAGRAKIFSDWYGPLSAVKFQMIKFEGCFWNKQ